STEAFGTFGFDIHHRYSDTVMQFLNVDGLPEKGTVDYYAAMAHRDQLFKGRRLASTASTPILTFYGGNETYHIMSLSHGTPNLEFLVALDTGSNLFWLPCDCTNCARNFNFTDGSRFELETYSPSNSTTSKPPTRGCSTTLNVCSYQIINGNISSTGILVDDILHLGTESNPQDIVDVSITLGCAKNLSGSFLNTNGGINGVFGLGMDSISVPSILADKGVVANSFSMCFGSGEIGRIEFGDKGIRNKKQLPLIFNNHSKQQVINPMLFLRPTYNITVTKIGVGNNVTDLEFTANFDSSVAYTHITDPAYSFIVNNVTCESMNSEAIFIFCKRYITPNLTFTMKGGSQFNVTAPTIEFIRKVRNS
ncbi:hypothetical protein MIMGU_mgv1a019366mg, partial [Erythranthe guttata]